MQLICDALSVLGSRHGLLWNPLTKDCGIIRSMPFNELPALEIRAGVVIDGQEYLLPLCHDGGNFTFYDQRLSPCTMTLMGIDAGSATKLQLTVVTPFRPRDLDFSTIPVLGLRLSLTRLGGTFRWDPKQVDLQEAEIFLEFTGAGVAVAPSGDDAVAVTVGEQEDRLVAMSGERRGTRFVKRVTLGEEASLDLAWCTYSAPELEVQGTRHPFWYARSFATLEDVCAWARTNPTALFDNARVVDGLIAQNSCSLSVNHLLAQTLHSWLIDTWAADRAGTPWFSVWEGSCYFHSTVDVEYTQTPFYLAVWPELLGYELDFWPEYSKDGTRSIGERGEWTRFLSHDIGRMSAANGQAYDHEMEVEETTNYLILAFVYYRRTGDDRLLRKHAGVIRDYLAFVAACDTTGNGVPDLGVANTIDDASPAVQFGEEQVYLAVKALAAYQVGAEMLAVLGDDDLATRYQALAATIRTHIEAAGWQGDHYATLLKKGGTIKDAWQKIEYTLEEIPGWDAAHIYTVNGLALLDMLGYDLGLDREKLTTDLRVATARCLHEYGCVHSDFTPERLAELMPGLAGSAPNPGWISMNMLRDMAAFYRGVDLRHLADRYWEWQTTTNSQEPKIFFETFNGNNLCFYPRGIAIWGYFDALAGRTIDKVAGIDAETRPFPDMVLPRLLDLDWTAAPEG
jgi:hypothetical protein